MNNPQSPGLILFTWLSCLFAFRSVLASSLSKRIRAWLRGEAVEEMATLTVPAPPGVARGLGPEQNCDKGKQWDSPDQVQEPDSESTSAMGRLHDAIRAL